MYARILLLLGFGNAYMLQERAVCGTPVVTDATLRIAFVGEAVESTGPA